MGCQLTTLGQPHWCRERQPEEHGIMWWSMKLAKTEPGTGPMRQNSPSIGGLFSTMHVRNLGGTTWFPRASPLPWLHPIAGAALCGSGFIQGCAKPDPQRKRRNGSSRSFASGCPSAVMRQENRTFWSGGSLARSTRMTGLCCAWLPCAPPPWLHASTRRARPSTTMEPIGDPYPWHYGKHAGFTCWGHQATMG